MKPERVQKKYPGGELDNKLLGMLDRILDRSEFV